MKTNKTFLVSCAIAGTIPLLIGATGKLTDPVADNIVADQRAALAKTTDGAGFGPQAPRDIDSVVGNNKRLFVEAPAYT